MAQIYREKTKQLRLSMDDLTLIRMLLANTVLSGTNPWAKIGFNLSEALDDFGLCYEHGMYLIDPIADMGPGLTFKQETKKPATATPKDCPPDTPCTWGRLRRYAKDCE